MFNGAVYVLVIREHVRETSGQMQVVQKYTNIINTPSIKTWFKLSQSFSWCERKTLANIGPRGDPAATEST